MAGERNARLRLVRTERLVLEARWNGLSQYAKGSDPFKVRAKDILDSDVIRLLKTQIASIDSELAAAQVKESEVAAERGRDGRPRRRARDLPARDRRVRGRPRAGPGRAAAHRRAQPRLRAPGRVRGRRRGPRGVARRLDRLVEADRRADQGGEASMAADVVGREGLLDEEQVEGVEAGELGASEGGQDVGCLLYTSPSPRDRTRSRMPSSA